MPDHISKQIPSIINEILVDYEKGRSIDKLDVFNQPDQRIIKELIGKLYRIIFPGYFKEQIYRVYNIKNNLSLVMEDVAYLLNKQISVALRCNSSIGNQDDMLINETSQCITLDFFRRMPYVRDFIETDVQATLDGDPAAYNEDEIIFSYPGIYAITVHRLAHELHQLGVPIIPRIMSEYAHSRTGIDIHPGAQIGRYFFIDHGTGIVIGETTTIGSHVKVYQGVTLGALSTQGGRRLKNSKRHPTIEDNVTIYSGASILGGDTVVGAGSVVGGNVFLTRSIAPGTRISVRNQELRCDNDTTSNQPIPNDSLTDESWFYVI